MDAGGELAQVADGAAQLVGGGVQRLRRRGAAGLLDAQERVDEPLLRAVVEVAADPAALLGRGGHDPGARGGDLLRARLLGRGAGVGLLGLQLRVMSRKTTTAPLPSSVANGR